MSDQCSVCGLLEHEHGGSGHAFKKRVPPQEEPRKPEEIRRNLYSSVQALVDHDRESIWRIEERESIIERILNEMKILGHYPDDTCDPIVFRCGNVVVTAASKYDIKWTIVEPLAIKEDLY